MHQISPQKWHVIFGWPFFHLYWVEWTLLTTASFYTTNWWARVCHNISPIQSVKTEGFLIYISRGNMDGTAHIQHYSPHIQYNRHCCKIRSSCTKKLYGADNRIISVKSLFAINAYFYVVSSAQRRMYTIFFQINSKYAYLVKISIAIEAKLAAACIEITALSALCIF